MKTLCYSISIIHHDDFKPEVRYSSTHSYLVPRLRINEAIPLFPLYALMAWTGKALPFMFTLHFSLCTDCACSLLLILCEVMCLVFTVTFFISHLLHNKLCVSLHVIIILSFRLFLAEWTRPQTRCWSTAVRKVPGSTGGFVKVACWHRGDGSQPEATLCWL